MNNHISSCRLGKPTDKFDNHPFYCVQNRLFFVTLTFMKLVEQNVLFDEKLLQTEVMTQSINHNGDVLIKGTLVNFKLYTP